GLKTRHGRLSLEGVVPLCARFDTVGPLCRSVEDAALLLAALESGKPVDLTGASLKGVRLGVLQTQAFNGIEDAPQNAFQDAIKRLQAAGATTHPLQVPAVAEAAALGPTVFPAEAYATWQERIDAEGDKMYPPVRTRFLQGQTISAAEFIQAWRELDRLRLVYAEATAEFDAVVLPSCPILPPKAEALLADEDLFTSQNLMALQNTRIGNLMGLAAITLPTGVPSTGLMLQGPNEERLLRLAVAAEEALR
ncbi:MAG: amidase family protein, partial [Paracoccaceae bacterium]|nr:amidase family protein [Paracoccaceae bacterium]